MDEPGAYLRRLPIGERLPVGEVIDDPLFPFEGEITTQPIQPPTLPEPERRGVDEAACTSCNGSGDEAIVAWTDDRWRVLIDPEPHALPMVAILQPKAHADLEDLPPREAAELGPMIQRLARAIGRVDGVGRVHVNRWGDGSFHFHVWFLARPRGMWQMRGAMLAIWDDLLPKVPRAAWEASRRTVAAAMAEGGGASRLASGPTTP